MAAGRAAACVFAHTFGVAIQIVDVGVASDLGAIDGIVHANVRRGTADLSVEAAMTADEARRALAVGREQAALAIDDGADLLIAGEIGIANTTSSAAVVCALLNEEPACVVGRGTGVDGDGLEHKIRVVSAALARVREAAIVDPFAILANLGGLEIAAMAGVYLESARRGVPVILDGFISAAAAAVAVSMEPACRAWLLAGHLSAEVGHQRVLEWLQLKPILELGLRLGEGTGALLAWPIVRAALAMHAEMQTFDEAGVSGRS